MEYRGEVLNLAQSIIEIPNGVMIMLDGKSFAGISSSLNEILLMVPSHQMFLKSR